MLHLIAASLVFVSSLAASAPDPRVRDAVVAAVHQRVGEDADVIVEAIETFIPSGASASARIGAAADPAARLGGLVRFTLTVDGVRSGRADATLHVIADGARATRAVSRGATLGPADVADVRDEITSGPLRRRARAAELTGGRALRDLAAGAPVTAQAVLVPPTVRTGQPVTAISRAAGIEASATMVAAESGNPGSVIRVVNHATRKTARARVVSSEVVEIIHD